MDDFCGMLFPERGAERFVLHNKGSVKHIAYRAKNIGAAWREMSEEEAWEYWALLRDKWGIGGETPDDSRKFRKNYFSVRCESESFPPHPAPWPPDLLARERLREQSSVVFFWGSPANSPFFFFEKGWAALRCVYEIADVILLDRPWFSDINGNFLFHRSHHCGLLALGKAENWLGDEWGPRLKLQKAAEIGDIGGIRAALALKDFDLEDIIDYLDSAAKNGHQQACSYLLDVFDQKFRENYGQENWREESYQMRSPIVSAAAFDHQQIVQLFLERKKATAWGQIEAFLIAARKGHFEIVQIFLNNGIAPDIVPLVVPYEGETPLEAALNGLSLDIWGGGPERTEVQEVVSAGVQDLLRSMHESGRIEAAFLLLERGADPARFSAPLDGPAARLLRDIQRARGKGLEASAFLERRAAGPAPAGRLREGLRRIASRLGLR